MYLKIKISKYSIGLFLENATVASAAVAFSCGAGPVASEWSANQDEAGKMLIFLEVVISKETAR